MAHPHQKKTKLLKGTLRAVRTGKDLGDKTQSRLGVALGRIAADDYSPGDFADDVIGQSLDLFTAFRDFASGTSDVPTTYIITNTANPGAQLVALGDTVDGALLEVMDLLGPVTTSGGTTTQHAVTVANIEITNPDT